MPGSCLYKHLIIILHLFLTGATAATGQENILQSTHSFRNGIVKTGTALNIISRKTGYYFTYDSKIINTEAKVRLDITEAPLEKILKIIVGSDSMKFSVIGSHIIIAKISPVLIARAVEGSPAKEIFRINGRVVDNENGDPLPYATIAIIGKPRGTISNNDGYFTLSVTADMLEDTITISYLGFKNRIIPVSETLDNFFTIRMFRDYIPIPEIIIKSQIPEEIIRKFIAAIPGNYGSTPANLRAFYREGVLKGKVLMLYLEAVLSIYKSAYSGSQNDQVRIERSRKTENINPSDTLVLRLKAGLNSSLLLDGVRNLYEFMDEDFFNLYHYRMTDIVTIDDEAAFVIEFEQRPEVREPLYRGTLLINTSDYALMKAYFELHPSYITDRSLSLVTSSVRGFTIKPVSVSYKAGYKKVDGRYFLSHVRGDLKFSAKKKRSLFRSFYSVFFEMAITEADTENVARFERNETTPLESVFSRTIKGYDAEFWGDFDFLNPEEDILKALSNIPLKISGYIGNNAR